MSCCGGKCGCGSSCSCGSGCNGCAKYPDSGFSEATANETFIAGVAPECHERSGMMSFASENGCKCGSNCTCDPCSCK